MITLSEEQLAALSAIHSWYLQESSPFFLLSGFAGTGKTTAMREFVKGFKKAEIVFTATTNKATRVLKKALNPEGAEGKLGDKIPCMTIYSALGLKLDATGEIKEIVQGEEKIDPAITKLVVIDEGSMISKKLFEYIEDFCKLVGTRFLFLGDSAQLPPVGEKLSVIWGIGDSARNLGGSASLTTIHRNAGAILRFATNVRKQIGQFAPSITPISDNDGSKGVFKCLPPAFEQHVLSAIACGCFQAPEHSKIIAWRNATVDKWNDRIRREVYRNSEFGENLPKYIKGERIIFCAPVTEFSENGERRRVASTDEEGVITQINTKPHPTYPDVPCLELRVSLDSGGGIISAWEAKDQGAFKRIVHNLSEQAKKAPYLWKAFWEFIDAFAQIKYSYAITAHRSQGSTYKNAFICLTDILRNSNREEAFKCLYVACSRAQEKLILGIGV